MKRYIPRPPKVCNDCEHGVTPSKRRHCAATHEISDWIEDETGRWRTVTGGLCLRVDQREAA